MIVVDIKYNKKDEKTYKYLLIAPKGMKINRDKPLIHVTGVKNGKLLKKYLYIIDYKIEKELPTVISKQIILIDNNNNIDIEFIKKATKTVTPASDCLDEIREKFREKSIKNYEKFCKSIGAKFPWGPIKIK